MAGCLSVYHLGLYRIPLSQILLEPDLARFRNSNASRAGFGENYFLDYRTIRLMKLKASTMLSAAIMKQYSSVLYFCVTVCQFLTKFVESQCILFFNIQVTLIKIVYSPLDRSAALVLSVIN